MSKWQRVYYQPNLPLGEDGTKVTACKEHIELSKAAAKEGTLIAISMTAINRHIPSFNCRTLFHYR